MQDTDGLGDWRTAASSRLAQDLPAAYPGGPSHKAGSILSQSALVVTEQGEKIGFVVPSAAALALSIAQQARDRAEERYSQLSFVEVPTPLGQARSIPADDKGALFDFFEQCMIAATFSYQALEVFANQTIARELRQPTKVMYRGKAVEMTSTEIENRLSTSEKLSGVMPRIWGVPTPKGQAIWQRYRKLEEARDATIHLKYKDQVPITSEGLFYQFLSRRVSDYPKAAADMMRYFTGDSPPRWLDLCGL